MTDKERYEEMLRAMTKFSAAHVRVISSAWFPAGNKPTLQYHVNRKSLQLAKVHSWTDIACDVDIPAATSEYDALMKRLKQ